MLEDLLTNSGRYPPTSQEWNWCPDFGVQKAGCSAFIWSRKKFSVSAGEIRNCGKSNQIEDFLAMDGHGLIPIFGQCPHWCPQIRESQLDFTRGVWEMGSLRRRFEALVKAHGEASTLADGLVTVWTENNKIWTTNRTGGHHFVWVGGNILVAISNSMPKPIITIAFSGCKQNLLVSTVSTATKWAISQVWPMGPWAFPCATPKRQHLATAAFCEQLEQLCRLPLHSAAVAAAVAVAVGFSGVPSRAGWVEDCRRSCWTLRSSWSGERQGFCEHVGQCWFEKQHVDNMLMVYHQKCPYEIGYLKKVCSISRHPHVEKLEWNVNR